MTNGGDARFDHGDPSEFEDPLARPPHVIRRAGDRGGAEFVRHVLAEEGIPATAERDRRRGDWQVLVAEAAIEDAERVLANRESMASGIDWENFDPGEMSPRDARIMAGSARRLRLMRRLLTLGSTLLLLMVLLGLLAMIADLLPSRESEIAPPAAAELEDSKRPAGGSDDASDPEFDPT